jgi:hypothetical protein
MSIVTSLNPTSERYAKVIETSCRMRWEIERDVIRGRRLDLACDFLPLGLSLVEELPFLGHDDRRLMSQVQGRTYAYMFGLVERFIGAKMLQIGCERSLEDPVEVQALVRMTDEELKHQALFRRLEELMEAAMPAGYQRSADPDAVARAVLGKSTWAVLALTLHIELFTMAHYRASIAPHAGLSCLWKDVFLFHWREEAQHAVLDELELLREDAYLFKPARDAAVDDLIDLVVAVDGIVQAQADADARYFRTLSATAFSPHERQQIEDLMLKAYRWQYIVSGTTEPRFSKLLFSLLDDEQAQRIQLALEPLAYAKPSRLDIPMAA